MRNLRVSATFSKYVFGGFIILMSAPLIMILLLSVSSALLNNLLTDSYIVSSKVEIIKKDSGQDITYLPIYHYFVDGVEHICSSDPSSYIQPSDKNVKIYYNSKNPNICFSEYETDIDYIGTLIFVIILTALTTLGLFLIINTFLKNAKIKQLTKTGKLIKDIPCKIFPKGIRTRGYPLIFEADYTWRWGYGTQGYIIEVEYDGLKLKSEIKYQIDIRRNTADLLIDPINPKNYFIDFDIAEN